MLYDDDLMRLFPAECHNYWKGVFRLTRFLKHNRKLLLSHESMAVEAIIAEWIPHALKHYPREALANEIDADDIGMIVAEKWHDALWPLGFHPIAEAVDMSHHYSGIPKPPAKYGELAAQVWRVVWCLNLLCLKSGESTFYLSTHDLSRRLERAQQMIYRTMKRMEKDGLLKVFKRGTRGEKGGHATIYQAF